MSNCSCGISSSITGVCIADFYNERRVKKARKSHKCGECHQAIHSGSPYMYISGVWDDDFCSHKVCVDCQSVVDALLYNGYVCGCVWDDVGEHINDVDGNIPESCIVALTEAARWKVCELIEDCWSRAR